jgi:uncharacterized protein (DUF433 family)
MEKKKLIGAAAFSLALAGGGVAGAIIGSPLSSGAQESTTTTTAPANGAPDGGGRPFMDHGPGHREKGMGLDAAATAIGITPEELRTELQAGKTIAQVAQAHDVDPQKVIDAMVTQATANLRDRITNLVNNPLPERGQGRGGELRADFTKVAGVIGVTPEELRTALQSGQSIAQVAQAHDVDPQKVIDALVAAGVPSDRATNIVNHVGGFHRGPHPDGDQAPPVSGGSGA